jgi:hypothetical protein
LTDFATPMLWSPDQLDTDIETSIEVFRTERFEESAEVYPDKFDEVIGNIETLLEHTDNLSLFAESARDVVSNDALREALRYLAGPPISNDDFNVLVNARNKKQFSDPDVIQRTIETLQATLDRRRFPWVGENRPPTDFERDAAILASAALLASQRISTWRKNEAKRLQEESVKKFLREHGFKQIPVSSRGIRTPADGPKPGEFCGETKLGTRKADVVAMLWDNRLMPIECKVSNSFLNSVKRLNNDAAVKANIWTKEFGEFIVPTAIISGVFKRMNIEAAQRNGLMIIWAHRLSDLTTFIDQTRP